MTFTRGGYYDQFLAHLFRGKSLVVGGFDFLFGFVCVVCTCVCMYDPRRVRAELSLHSSMALYLTF